ncbi:hypothetical protein EXW41_28365 (plasmid) [Bacillus wiedmannii]|nr:hypothetical protein EXW41_28365 [Bacillus wiedmannii]
MMGSFLNNSRINIEWSFKMRLVYFWISNVFNTNDIEFNLGANYRFSFEDEINTLRAEKNESFVDNFYHLPILENNIDINVNAIVGENGTGKTSIIEALRDVLHGNYKHKFLYVISKNDKFEYCSNIEGVIVKGINMQYRGKRARGIKRILYSNVFDTGALNKKVLNTHSYQDVTTNSLIRFNGSVNWYLSKELSSQINFCLKFQESSLTESLKIPKNIKLKLNSDKNTSDIFPNNLAEYIQKISSRTFTNKIFSTFVESDVYSEKIKGKKVKNDFYFFYLKQVIYYYFCEIDGFIYKNFPRSKFYFLLGGFYSRYYRALESFIDMINKPNGNPSIERLNKFLHRALSGNKSEHEISLDKKEFLKFLNSLNEEITSLLNLINEDFIIPINGTSGKAELANLSPEVVAIFQKWTNYTLGSLVWTELSSGEYAMLSMFSRIYAAKNQLIVNKEDAMTIILIDEGELYYHPQWQKDWLYTLLKGLNVIFEDQKNEEIQILLTTHSPFILSDIPNDRVLFLKKSRDGEHTIIENYLLESPLTWGANIHSLYANSFFLYDGLMGSFAKEKINHLIHELIHIEPEELRNYSGVIRNKIDLIGEPIIKNKLIELYQQKISLLKPETQLIYEEMKSLKERLNQLEQLAKKGGEI